MRKCVFKMSEIRYVESQALIGLSTKNYSFLRYGAEMVLKWTLDRCIHPPPVNFKADDNYFSRCCRNR